MNICKECGKEKGHYDKCDCEERKIDKIQLALNQYDNDPNLETYQLVDKIRDILRGD